MTTRILPHDEWTKLAETDLGPLVAVLDPEKATIFVVEDATGTIIGCWSLLKCLHAEGLWVAPDHRKAAGVFRQLLATMRQELHARHEGVLWTSSVSPEVDRLVTHSGGLPIPGTHYAIPVL